VSAAEAVAATATRRAHANTPSLRFRVRDWMAFAEGRLGRQDWLAWAGVAGAPAAAAERDDVALPALLRRRVSAVGQQAFRAAAMLGERTDCRIVFCSRHGEFQRTLGIVRAIVDREPTSPADFSLSVHNALAGLLSIAWKNRLGHTAVAAGVDSFGYGLLEAVASLQADPAQQVLLVYFDEPLPDVYAELDGDGDTTLAVALLLDGAAGDEDDVILATEPRDRAEAPRPATGQALDFLRFFLSGRAEAQSPGADIRWRWHRAG
jgi:hypothetical protein